MPGIIISTSQTGRHLACSDMVDGSSIRPPSQQTATNPEGKYLAIYETDASNPGKAGEGLGKLRPTWEQRGRLFDAIERVFRITARPM